LREIHNLSDNNAAVLQIFDHSIDRLKQFFLKITIEVKFCWLHMLDLEKVSELI